MSPLPVQVMRCGNCGADVPVTSPATINVTCEHCGTLNTRGDVDLKSLGQVALPAPLASNFALGTEGRFEGRSFVVRGQIQLNHGAGLWNEWAAETDAGWIWIAEAQGETHVYEEVALEPSAEVAAEHLPPQDGDGSFVEGDRKTRHWRAGGRLSLGAHGKWTISEIGRGDVVACRGEFPIDVGVGERTTYIDLVQGSSSVATLDFTRGDHPEFLTGKRVPLDTLQIDPSTQPDHRPDTIQSDAVTCSACGGTIEVQDPEHALTLGCQHCGTTLTRETHLDAYHAAEREEETRRKPGIPIGSTASLHGEDVTVIGYMRKGVWADGRLWPWSEYLLRTADGGYRWLVESDGHWSFVNPMSAASGSKRGSTLEFAGNEYKHFSGGLATVDTVLGEFYWQVRSGDASRTDDYVHPATGTMFSLESGPFEATASRGAYLPLDVMEDAFPAAKLPRPRGVGAMQPNPISSRSVWKAYVLLVVLLMSSCVAVRVHHANEVVHAGTYGPTSNIAAEELVQFSDPFEIQADHANAKVMIQASSLNQGYLDVMGALVNENTGAVVTFATAAQRYSGVSGGESWSEGNRKGKVLLGKIPAGTYRLRLAARGFDNAVQTKYQVTVKSQVPTMGWFVLVFFALLIWPVVQTIRAGAFETRRWSNSDHAG